MPLLDVTLPLLLCAHQQLNKSRPIGSTARRCAPPRSFSSPSHKSPPPRLHKTATISLDAASLAGLRDVIKLELPSALSPTAAKAPQQARALEREGELKEIIKQLKDTIKDL